jgi:hypothetical protein
VRQKSPYLLPGPALPKSPTFELEFGISGSDERETVGAIKHIIVAGSGYSERQAEMLTKILEA